MVLKVNGAEIPAPSEMKVALTEVGSGELRSASGALVKDVTAVKRRLSLRWAHLDPEALSGLLGAVSAGFFEAEYPDPASAAPRTAVFRAGETGAGVLRMQNGRPVWTGVTMEWTER